MAISGVLVFFLLLGVCHAEMCKCISYVISENGLSTENEISSMVFELEDIKCDGDGLMKCKTTCEDMYNDLTDKGKICIKYPGKDLRVADWMCAEMKRDVCNARIGVFAQNCGGDPIDTGFRFLETLCCKSGYAMYC